MSAGERAPKGVTSLETLHTLRQRHRGSMIIAGVEAAERYVGTPAEQRNPAMQPEHDAAYVHARTAYDRVSAQLKGTLVEF